VAENSSEKNLLKKAQAEFELVVEAEAETRKLSLEDFEFESGIQWHQSLKYDRERDGRPCLVINKTKQFVNQITNDQRQNRPSIKVYPVDDRADIETAKVIQGLVRHIEYNSNADTAYDTAFECAVKGGLGYFRIITDFVDPIGFDQEILIKRIKNPFSVYFDPFSNEPDGSDASFAFITEDLSKDEYKRRYPDSKLATQDGWEACGNTLPSWMPGGSARVAEYFYKVFEKKEVVLLSTGETVLKDELPEFLPEGVSVLNSRVSQVPKIKWAKINGVEILEETDWPGAFIPIVPVYGVESDINGKKIIEGIVRNAKDPARMYNYWASAETEAIALAPRAPFVAAEGQIEGYEQDWENANRRNHAVLKYKPSDVNGTPLPPPQRQAFEPAVQAITNARMLASDDIKATTGIYDASLGAKSNETSGVAIQRRNMQAQTSNFHFVDNLTRSLRHAGRIIIDLIPKIYDTPRTARIIGEDGEHQVVKVNDPTFMKDGKPSLYALDVGKYDVVVDVGPSFQTKRQEAVASMLEVTKAMPQFMAIAGDLIVKNMDWPGSQEIAERIKKTMPPNIVEDKKDQQIPPQVQAQVMQMNQMIEQLTGKLNELHEEREKKLVEIESRERIELQKIQANLEIEMARLGSKESIELLKQEINQIEQRMALLNQYQPIDTESFEPHESEMGNQEGGVNQELIGEQPPSTPMEGVSP